MSYAALLYESDRPEPRLRRILGHIRIYENAVGVYQEAMQKRASCPGRKEKRMRNAVADEDDVKIDATIAAMRLTKDSLEGEENEENEESEESAESEESDESESESEESEDSDESEETDEDEESEASEAGNKDHDDNFFGASEQAVTGRLEPLLKAFASQDGRMVGRHGLQERYQDTQFLKATAKAK
jgi:hypothetical protein